MKRGLLLLAGLSAGLVGARGIPPAPVGITNLYELAEHAGTLNRLPPHLMRALVNTESAGDTRALSNKGAMGLAQLMPGTAREMGVTDPWDPWQNLYGGAKYLRQQLDTFGRTDYALAAYNAGAGNVRAYKGIPPFKETQDYVQRITALYALYSGAPASPLPPLAVAPLPAVLPLPSTSLPQKQRLSPRPFVPPVMPPFVPPPLPTLTPSALPSVTATVRPLPASPVPVVQKSISPQMESYIPIKTQTPAFSLQTGGLSGSQASSGFSLVTAPLGGGQP